MKPTYYCPRCDLHLGTDDVEAETIHETHEIHRCSTCGLRVIETDE